MRRTIPFLIALCVATVCPIGSAGAQPVDPADQPGMRVRPWTFAQPGDLDPLFERAARPFEPLDQVRPEIEALDDERLLRLLNRTRREIRNRVMRERIRKQFSGPMATRLERAYRLEPKPAVDGFSILENETLEAVYYEARSEAFGRSLITGSCELEAIYDTPPAEQDPALPHVPAGEKDILDAARAVVAIIDKSLLEEKTGGYELTSRRFTLLGSFYLCDFSALYGLPMTAIYGTGFLIDGGRIVTAAHVANEVNFLDRARFVFGYTMPAPDGEKTFFDTEQVYEASAEIYSLEDEHGRDFAVLQLATTPPDAKYPPLKLRESGRIQNHESVYTIGHPLGLPQMYTGPKPLYENGPCTYFMSTLDTYDYQSGSPVINAETHEVEGILTSGTKEMRSYCDCEAPVASTSEDGLSTSFAVRAKLVADVLGHMDELIVVNDSDEPVLVRTDEDHAFDGGESKTIPYTEEMTLYQLPEFDADDPSEVLYQCSLLYYPVPGETWRIMKGDQSGALIMARCVEESLAVIED